MIVSRLSRQLLDSVPLISSDALLAVRSERDTTVDAYTTAVARGAAGEAAAALRIMAELTTLVDELSAEVGLGGLRL